MTRPLTRQEMEAPDWTRTISVLDDFLAEHGEAGAAEAAKRQVRLTWRVSLHYNGVELCAYEQKIYLENFSFYLRNVAHRSPL